MNSKMTISPQEAEIIKHLSEALKIMLGLEEMHESEKQEFSYAVHRLQDLILARVVLRYIRRNRNEIIKR